MSSDMIAGSSPPHFPSEPSKRLFHVVRGLTAREAALQSRVDWLWHGYLAPGCLTLFTGPWKLGKTTLIAALLGRMATGGELAGQTVRPGRVLVLSDESLELWHRRILEFDIGDHVGLLCKPFCGHPLPEEWDGLVNYLTQLHADEGLDLVVIDSLASFMVGRDENNAKSMMQTLLPLQRLTNKGVALLMVHHPRRQRSAPGHTMRGSGALPASVDILLEMDWFQRDDETDRRRQLYAYSRFAETTHRQVCEWTAGSRDYRSLGNFRDTAFTDSWEVLRLVFEDATGKLKRQEIFAQWPSDYPRPDPLTVWRWLDQALARELICRDGLGRRSSPYRYWLPQREEQWKQDPFYFLEQQAEQDRIHIEKIMGPPPYGIG
jgi:hypothetical protein